MNLIPALALSVVFGSLGGLPCQETLSAPDTNQKSALKVIRTWRPATYRGLEVGRSTRAKLLKVFGKPKRKDFPDEQSDGKKVREIWYVYDDIGEFPGEFVVAIDRRTEQIRSMVLYPENLSVQTAIKRFGSTYLETKYEFCPGFEDADAAPVFESSHGNALYIEYRERGLALFIGDGDTVNDVRYLANPIGFRSKAGCDDAQKKYKARNSRRK